MVEVAVLQEWDFVAYKQDSIKPIGFEYIHCEKNYKNKPKNVVKNTQKKRTEIVKNNRTSIDNCVNSKSVNNIVAQKLSRVALLVK